MEQFQLWIFVKSKYLFECCIIKLFSAILQNLKIDRGRIQKLSTGFNGLLVSFADGGVCLYDDPSNSAQSKYEFTGADCDATYDFTHTSDKLFTACRDKVVRKYALEGLLN